MNKIIATWLGPVEDSVINEMHCHLQVLHGEDAEGNQYHCPMVWTDEDERKGFCQQVRENALGALEVLASDEYKEVMGTDDN